MTETKHEKFTRISGTRLPNAVKAIELIGNLSSNNYEYSAPEARNMIYTLLKPLQRVARDFGVPFKVMGEDAPDAVDAPAPRMKSAPADAGDKRIEFQQWSKVDQAYNALVEGDAETAKALLLEAMRT